MPAPVVRQAQQPSPRGELVAGESRGARSGAEVLMAAFLLEAFGEALSEKARAEVEMARLVAAWLRVPWVACPCPCPQQTLQGLTPPCAAWMGLVGLPGGGLRGSTRLGPPMLTLLCAAE